MLQQRFFIGVLAAAALLVGAVAYVAFRDDEGAALDTGRHLVHIVDLDAGDRTIVVDEARWLSGAAADEAWAAEHPGETGGAPNGYFILDENDRTTELDIARDVEVSIVGLSRDSDADLDPSSLAALPDYLAEAPDPDGRWLSLLPYWIVVRDDGEVALIEEQYVP